MEYLLALVAPMYFEPVAVYNFERDAEIIKWALDELLEETRDKHDFSFKIVPVKKNVEFTELKEKYKDILEAE